MPSSSVGSSAPGAAEPPKIGWFVPPLDLAALGGGGPGTMNPKAKRAPKDKTGSAASQGDGMPGLQQKHPQDEKLKKPQESDQPLTVEDMLEADNGESSDDEE